ncbi:hypothetical protein NV381_34930 [Paenibacillus sp. N5-1-1-5]|uniref:DUF4870 domain-containing protein n=2 Tax=Paenibacillus TaxID=44249 RepID=A0ABT1YT74_9BACL|nr:hypothetical protein [Paenibacillus radicis (ex Xue et al. 2023)]
MKEVDTLSSIPENNSPGQSNSTLTADPADVNANKWIGVLAYILFFLPLLAAKESRFAMYHANQGLVLLILGIACNIVLGLIPVIGWILLPLANLATLVLAILGIIQAANGQLKPLPLIGGITIIKTP